MPFSIHLRRNDYTGLLFTVGLEVNHLEFYSENASPIIVGCCGPRNDDEIISPRKPASITTWPFRVKDYGDEPRSGCILFFYSFCRLCWIDWSRLTRNCLKLIWAWKPTRNWNLCGHLALDRWFCGHRFIRAGNGLVVYWDQLSKAYN